MIVVIVDQRGAVSDDLFNEVLARFLNDNPSFTLYDPSVAHYRMGRCEYKIHELSHILRGPCLEFCDRGHAFDALKALSVMYPKLAFGFEYSRDETDYNLYHGLLQDGKYKDSQFDGASYWVPSLCTPCTPFFDCLVPNTLADRARVKMLRARQDIVKVADMLQDALFTGSPMRDGGDKVKTAKVTAQMRAAADALKILDDLDFEGVIAENPTNQPWFPNFEGKV